MSVSYRTEATHVGRTAINRATAESAFAAVITHHQALIWSFAAGARAIFRRPIDYLRRWFNPACNPSNIQRRLSPPAVDGNPMEVDTHVGDGPQTPMPPHILDKIKQYEAVRKDRQDLLNWISDKLQPSGDVFKRIQVAMERVRGRMAFSMKFEHSDDVYNSLGQRLEDLQHCVYHLSREHEVALEQLQDLEYDMIAEGNELVEMIQAWLNKGIVKESSEPEGTHWEAPFDLKIIEGAEAVCDERETADQEEEEFLSHMPFQPEGVTYSRKWNTIEVRSRLDQARKALKDSTEQFERFQRVQTAHEAGDHSCDWELPDDEDFDLKSALEVTEENVKTWEHNFQFCIDVLRQLGKKVTSNGTIIQTELPKRQAASTFDVIMWGAEEPDDEDELNEDQLAEKIEESAEIVGPWLDGVELWGGSSTPFATEAQQVRCVPTYEGDELSDPTPLDSISHGEGSRMDFGYSIYRLELDRMARLQEAARAELPSDALPAAEGEPGCE